MKLRRQNQRFLALGCLALASCGQPLHLASDDSLVGQAAVVQDIAPGVYLLTPGRLGVPLVLHAMALTQSSEPIVATARHLKLTSSGLTLAWPFMESAAITLVAYIDANGDGICNESGLRWAIEGDPSRPRRVVLNDMANADVCPAFNGLQAASPAFKLYLYTKAIRTDLALTIQVKNETTADVLFDGMLTAVDGVVLVPTALQPGEGYSVNATGDGVALGVSLGAVFIDTALVIKGPDASP